MARSQIEEFLALADSVKAAAGLVASKASLEQACKEAEQRLTSLRAAESVVKKELDAAAERTKHTLASAESDSAGLRAAAHEACVSKLTECEAACSLREEQAQAVCDAYAREAEARKATIAALEAEESKLGQSVASLRADLAALRAKLA